MSNYVAYSDESYVRDRFRSTACFSFLAEHHARVEEALSGALQRSGVNEFKWSELRDARHRFCAEHMVEALWDVLYRAEGRVDVLVWDTQDARHDIAGRDDVANYGRMFYHLHRTVLHQRPKGSTWLLYPDQQSEIDWNTARECLAAVGRRQEIVRSPLFGDLLADPNHHIERLQEVDSREAVCLQVADLFAGLVVFSKTEYERYDAWVQSTQPTLGLFVEKPVTLTNRDKARFQFLRHFNAACKQRKLGVSLKTYRCLFTFTADGPFNFWHYSPQHEMDRAPTR